MRGNVIRENDKSNFLASFKKVILLPVSVLPNLPFPGTHSHSRSSTATGKTSTPNQSGTPARPSTPSGWEDTPTPPSSLSNNPQPATELAAQTAILNSRLERIKTLFSIEVALQLIHTGKETLERIKSFRRFPGEIGEKVYASPPVLLTLDDKAVKLHL
jgi:recyclin-1